MPVRAVHYVALVKEYPFPPGLRSLPLKRDTNFRLNMPLSGYDRVYMQI